MTLTRSLLRSSFFFRRRRPRSNAGRRISPFFRRRSPAGDNPEPSSPKVTCIGQVRVKSQKKVKQCRRRINGESSFRSASVPSFQRWVHLPCFSAVLREFFCLFRCKCERWWCGGGRRKMEIAVKCSGEEEEKVNSNSRQHVFDDIEVNGDRIEVKGRSFEDECAISVPPKNALLLMRCRSDPIKMAAIANRISSDAARYENVAIQLQEDEEEEDDGDDDETSSSDEVFEARVLEQVQKEFFANEAENNEKTEPEEDVESNMSSFEALLETEIEPKSDQKQEIHQEKGTLPECLLLMMREPKLSMEVSKETWVCSTDFIRLDPERPRRAAAKADAEPPIVKKMASVEKSKPRVPEPPRRNNDSQPARSSCSLPADGKCEPLELTRCKSEPMSKAAAKLMPEAGC
ncbi:hypothetical protein SASPL_152492 [Salvia splendens]|uniref:Uncharacterized protein n=1 Tax=Salvia splendens TaxID=180675 RepID=A0A8X8W395_SALSN|nr:uncharacterized protein LOC121783866 [Salvia splendens]KAG6387305.1 hypothetical protein SASPL_152492 [Salvia splendens]